MNSYIIPRIILQALIIFNLLVATRYIRFIALSFKRRMLKSFFFSPPEYAIADLGLLSGITAFEMEYSHWVEEQNRQIYELHNALQKHITDIELRILVENGLNHYNNLFRMKADAAKADVLSLISGMWRTSTERFFQWIGGFRPSELLNVKHSSVKH